MFSHADLIGPLLVKVSASVLDDISRMYGSCYDEPKRYRLMISTVNRSGCSINRPIIFYPFYKYLFPAWRKSQPGSKVPQILSRNPNKLLTARELHETSSALLLIFFPRFYPITLCTFSLLSLYSIQTPYNGKIFNLAYYHFFHQIRVRYPKYLTLCH